MKQGTSISHSGSQRPATIVHTVNPAAVAQIGIALGNHATGNGQILPGASVPLYRGRGLEAPMHSCETSNCGSQGRHK